MTIDPTREEWLEARKRMRKSAGCIVNLDESEVHRFTTAALGPCPPKPVPEPLLRGTQTLVRTMQGWVQVPNNALTPDEADAMAAALVEHARYARQALADVGR